VALGDDGGCLEPDRPGWNLESATYSHETSGTLPSLSVLSVLTCTMG
jgi:hypothetical protein